MLGAMNALGLTPFENYFIYRRRSIVGETFQLNKFTSSCSMRIML